VFYNISAKKYYQEFIINIKAVDYGLKEANATFKIIVYKDAPQVIKSFDNHEIKLGNNVDINLFGIFSDSDNDPLIFKAFILENSAKKNLVN
jgi:hypothetical protein